MYYLGLDVSSSNIGYALVKEGRVYACEVLKVKKNKDRRFALIEALDTLEYVIPSENVKIVIELPIGKFKTQKSGDVVHFAIGAAYAKVKKEHIDVFFITPLNWKKWFVNNALSDKLTIQQRVEELIGRFVEDDNESDAIGIAYTAYQLDQAGITDLYEK